MSKEINVDFEPSHHNVEGPQPLDGESFEALRKERQVEDSFPLPIYVMNCISAVALVTLVLAPKGQGIRYLVFVMIISPSFRC